MRALLKTRELAEFSDCTFHLFEDDSRTDIKFFVSNGFDILQHWISSWCINILLQYSWRNIIDRKGSNLWCKAILRQSLRKYVIDFTSIFQNFVFFTFVYVERVPILKCQCLFFINFHCFQTIVSEREFSFLIHNIACKYWTFVPWRGVNLSLACSFKTNILGGTDARSTLTHILSKSFDHLALLSITFGLSLLFLLIIYLEMWIRKSAICNLPVFKGFCNKCRSNLVWILECTALSADIKWTQYRS